MVTSSIGQFKDGINETIHVDLSRALMVRDNGDGDCVIFFSRETAGHTPFTPRPTVVCVQAEAILPLLSLDDWFVVQQVYSDGEERPCYIRLSDLYAYCKHPDKGGDTNLLGLWGAFGTMKVLYEALPAIQAEFARRRVS